MPRSASRRTQFVAVVLVILASATLLEFGTRAYFAIRVGPDVLLYGTGWHRAAMQERFMRGQNVFEHENEQAGYSKYFPHQVRRDVDETGAPFFVTINARGFRGRDYALEKPPGTLRVLALGASSTFGFGNRDENTYPALLEALLDERLAAKPCRGKVRAEVVNLAIPHLDSNQIAALFRSEGVAYQADVVTLYSGFNESRGLGQNGLLAGGARWSLVVNFLRVLRAQSVSVTRERLGNEKRERVARYRQGLDRILATARREGIQLVSMTQQATALSADAGARKGVTYEAEMTRLNRKLDSTGSVSVLEGKLLVHQAMMETLGAWAEENGLDTVDVIGLLDHHRHLLSTYVHLLPLGNDLIALAIADRLAQSLGCPSLATRFA